MRLVILASILFAAFAISCEKPLETFDNQAPLTFNVSSTLLDDSTARVDWTESFDPDKDSVVYDVYFMGQPVFSNLRTRSYNFNNLTRGKMYQGNIVARDAFFNETPVSFSFVTTSQDTTL